MEAKKVLLPVGNPPHLDFDKSRRCRGSLGSRLGLYRRFVYVSAGWRMWQQSQDAEPVLGMRRRRIKQNKLINSNNITMQSIKL